MCCRGRRGLPVTEFIEVFCTEKTFPDPHVEATFEHHMLTSLLAGASDLSLLPHHAMQGRAMVLSAAVVALFWLLHACMQREDSEVGSIATISS